ncbi:MAG: hypothetical protein Q8S44_00755 [Flavobacteriaceae bacterium]|nr:hypothetical protein [Flavobacteriaceae bacterium]
MKKLINKIVQYSPTFIKSFGINAYGYYWKKRRFGGVFKKELTEVKVREHFTEEQWRLYQTAQLRRLLIHAFQTVIFYQEKYKEAGFSLKDFENFELDQISRLPILEKDDLRRFGTSNLLSTKRERGIFLNSSGSTGTPVKIYFSKRFHQQWSALYEARVRNWAGVNYKQSRGMIGGRRIVPLANTKHPFYLRNRAENQTYFSAYHIGPKTINNYLEGMLKYPIDYLVGYATSIYILADLFDQYKLYPPPLKAVLTSSEKLTSNMRVCIEKVFQCKVFDAYSGVEACGLISENNQGELLFSPDSGIMEVIKNGGTPAQIGEIGEVIATGLLNFDQPLIRYRIGDEVIFSASQISKSEMNFPIIQEIEGRIEDVIIGVDGRKMVRFHSLFTDIPYLQMAQIEQFSRTEFVINLKVEQGFSSAQETIIKERLESQLGKSSLKFNFVDEIQRNENGKFKAVISNIK